MLFQINMTFRAENKVALLKRATEPKGIQIPPGMKVMNMWSSVNGHKVTTFAEVENPAAIMSFADSWDDLADIDSYPVITSEESVKIHLANSKK